MEPNPEERSSSVTQETVYDLATTTTATLTKEVCSRSFLKNGHYLGVGVDGNRRLGTGPLFLGKGSAQCLF